MATGWFSQTKNDYFHVHSKSCFFLNIVSLSCHYDYFILLCMSQPLHQIEIVWVKSWLHWSQWQNARWLKQSQKLQLVFTFQNLHRLSVPYLLVLFTYDILCFTPGVFLLFNMYQSGSLSRSFALSSMLPHMDLKIFKSATLSSYPYNSSNTI